MDSRHVVAVKQFFKDTVYFMCCFREYALLNMSIYALKRLQQILKPRLLIYEANALLKLAWLSEDMRK